jgi:integrase
MINIVVSRLKSCGTYFDETTPAFGLRVGKTKKTWFVIRGRQRLRTNVGHYPAMGLADARKEARRRLTADPTLPDRTTFDEAYERFKESIKGKKPRTQHDYKRVIEKHLQPKLGKKKLRDIAYDNVTTITDALARSEQRNTLAVALTFFRWCVRPPRRYIVHSPLEGVEVPKAKKRRRVLDADELVTVWNAALRQGYPHGTIVQLLVLTGQRRSEIANLRRSWINEKERTITLPEWLAKNPKSTRSPTAIW